MLAVKTLGLSLLFLTFINQTGAINHTGTSDYKVYKLSLSTTETIKELILSDLDVWSLDRNNKEAIVLLDSESLKKYSSLSPQIDQLKTLEYIMNTTARTNKDITSKYQCYRIVEKAYSDIETLQRNNPTLIEVERIGQSWQKLNKDKGYELKVIKITNQATSDRQKPILFIDASIHAREMATAELAMRFAESLVKKYKTNSKVKNLLDNKQVHIVPFVNPDGRKVAEGIVYQRKNRNETACRLSKKRHGIDLNRNFDTTGWGEGSGSQGSRSQCSDTYRGNHSHSEPETKAIVTYLESIFTNITNPTGIYISLHSFSELILLPNVDKKDRNSAEYKKVTSIGSILSKENGYKACIGDECLYPVHGSSDQWVFETFKIPSYTFELGKNFFEKCDFFENDVLPKNMKALYKALEILD